MYKVKVTVKPRNPQCPKMRYNTIVYNGIFVEKPESKISTQAIRDKVRDFILEKIKEQNRNLIMHASVFVDRAQIDFVIKEDED
jgi:hypothetical protein